MKTDYDGIDTSNSMTERDWDEVDKSSRAILSCFLLQTNATDIGETHGNCCLDLSCHINGKAIAFEIKDRSFPHDQYGDILVEDLKQDCNNRRIENGQFDAAIAVNVFTDKVIALANMLDANAKHFRRKAPVTTLVKGADHSYIWKSFCSLPQRRKYKYTSVDGKMKFQRLV